MGGENCTVLRLTLMHKLAMSLKKEKGPTTFSVVFKIKVWSKKHLGFQTKKTLEPPLKNGLRFLTDQM